MSVVLTNRHQKWDFWYQWVKRTGTKNSTKFQAWMARVVQNIYHSVDSPPPLIFLSLPSQAPSPHEHPIGCSCTLPPPPCAWSQPPLHACVRLLQLRAAPPRAPHRQVTLLGPTTAGHPQLGPLYPRTAGSYNEFMAGTCLRFSSGSELRFHFCWFNRRAVSLYLSVQLCGGSGWAGCRCASRSRSSASTRSSSLAARAPPRQRRCGPTIADFDLGPMGLNLGSGFFYFWKLIFGTGWRKQPTLKIKFVVLVHYNGHQ
jgi:hypothetical protein